MGAPPPAYETAVTQRTPVAEEKRSASTGIESERPLPRTPPTEQSNAPIKDQPVRIEYRHPLDQLKDGPPRSPSNLTLSGSNAGHTNAAQSAPAPQEQDPVAEERPPTSTGIESERPRPKTPPAAQSNAPIKEQPVRIEYRHPLDHGQDDPSRKPQGEQGRQLAQAGSMPSEQANQKPKKFFFCC